MKKEQAIQIATNFYTHREGVEPREIKVKRMEPANGHVTIWITGEEDEIGEDTIYEVEIDPMGDSVTMKRVLSEYKASDFIQQPKKLSELKNGDLFRLEHDCVIYEFWKWSGLHGQSQFIFTRQGKTDTIYSADRVVYPIGK